MIRPLALFLLLLGAPAAAQPVEDLYHSAAQLYVAGDAARAEAAAEAGLALDPDHAKLQALLEEIRQQRPPQDGGPQDDGSDQQQPGDGQQQQGDQQQEPGEQEPDEQDQEGEEQQGDAGQQQDSEASDAEPSPQPGEPGAMSRAEAERILQAIEADEVELLRDVQRRRARPRAVEKDW